MGNLLLGFALECMTVLALFGGSGVLEHPKEPDQEHMVSIWKLPIVHLLLAVAGVRLVTHSQGLLGAPSPKPTALMVLGLHDLEKEICLGRVTNELPKGSSVGRDEQGRYKTALLQEYPPAMCRSLAIAFSRDFVIPCAGRNVSPPDSFLALVKRMLGCHIGHDG